GVYTQWVTEVTSGSPYVPSARRSAGRATRALPPGKRDSEPQVNRNVFEGQYERRISIGLARCVGDDRSISQHSGDAHEQPRGAGVETEKRYRPGEIPRKGGSR